MRINENTYKRINKATLCIEEMGTKFILFVGKTSQNLGEYNYEVFNNFANMQREIILNAFVSLKDITSGSDGFIEKMNKFPAMMKSDGSKLYLYTSYLEEAVSKLVLRAERINIINNDTSNPIIPDDKDDLYQDLYLEFKSSRTGIYDVNYKGYLLNQYDDEGDVIANILNTYQQEIVQTLNFITNSLDNEFKNLGSKLGLKQAPIKLKLNIININKSTVSQSNKNENPTSSDDANNYSGKKKIIIKLPNPAIVKCNNGDFSSEYKSCVLNRYLNGNSNVKRVFDKYKDQLVVQDYSKEDSGAYYRPSGRYEKKQGVYFNADNDLINKRGPGTTYFHELGHMIDHLSGASNKYSSENGDFESALISDGKKILNSYNKLSVDKKEKLNQEFSAHYAHSFSDLIDGLTKGEIHGIYSHPRDYWKKSGSLPKEAFAHFFEASMGGGEKLNLLSNMFPNAYKSFLEIIESI